MSKNIYGIVFNYVYIRFEELLAEASIPLEKIENIDGRLPDFRFKYSSLKSLSELSLRHSKVILFFSLLYSKEIAKLVARKDTTVVYVKSKEVISDVLNAMSCRKCLSKLNRLVERKDRQNNANRVNNCSVSNIKAFEGHFVLFAFILEGNAGKRHRKPVFKHIGEKFRRLLVFGNQLEPEFAIAQQNASARLQIRKKAVGQDYRNNHKSVYKRN